MNSSTGGSTMVTVFQKMTLSTTGGTTSLTCYPSVTGLTANVKAQVTLTPNACQIVSCTFFSSGATVAAAFTRNSDNAVPVFSSIKDVGSFMQPTGSQAIQALLGAQRVASTAVYGEFYTGTMQDLRVRRIYAGDSFEEHIAPFLQSADAPDTLLSVSFRSGGDSTLMNDDQGRPVLEIDSQSSPATSALTLESSLMFVNDMNNCQRTLGSCGLGKYLMMAPGSSTMANCCSVPSNLTMAFTVMRPMNDEVSGDFYKIMLNSTDPLLKKFVQYKIIATTTVTQSLLYSGTVAGNMMWGMVPSSVFGQVQQEGIKISVLAIIASVSQEIKTWVINPRPFYMTIKSSVGTMWDLQSESMAKLSVVVGGSAVSSISNSTSMFSCKSGPPNDMRMVRLEPAMGAQTMWTLMVPASNISTGLGSAPNGTYVLECNMTVMGIQNMQARGRINIMAVKMFAKTTSVQVMMRAASGTQAVSNATHLSPMMDYFIKPMVAGWTNAQFDFQVLSMPGGSPFLTKFLTRSAANGGILLEGNQVRMALNSGGLFAFAPITVLVTGRKMVGGSIMYAKPAKATLAFMPARGDNNTGVCAPFLRRFQRVALSPSQSAYTCDLGIINFCKQGNMNRAWTPRCSRATGGNGLQLAMAPGDSTGCRQTVPLNKHNLNILRQGDVTLSFAVEFRENGVNASNASMVQTQTATIVLSRMTKLFKISYRFFSDDATPRELGEGRLYSSSTGNFLRVLKNNERSQKTSQPFRFKVHCVDPMATSPQTPMITVNLTGQCSRKRAMPNQHGAFEYGQRDYLGMCGNMCNMWTVARVSCRIGAHVQTDDLFLNYECPQPSPSKYCPATRVSAPSQAAN